MTPGEAMGVAGAVLRHNGFTIDECEAYPVGTGANLKVVGQFESQGP